MPSLVVIISNSRVNTLPTPWPTSRSGSSALPSVASVLNARELSDSIANDRITLSGSSAQATKMTATH